MEKTTFKISIITLLILSNCFIMAVFFGITSYFSQASYRQVLEKEFEEKQYQMLVYISDNLDQSMESIELLARSAANNYNIINGILNYRKNENSYEQLIFQNNMSQNLSSLAYSLGDIVSVNILIDDKNLRTTKMNGVYNYDSYTKDDCAYAIRELSSGWISTRKNDLQIQSYTPYITSYVLPIYSGLYYGDRIGQLVINLNERMFYTLMKEYYHDDDAVILLLDDKGIIISSTDRGTLGKNISETEYYRYQQILDEKQQNNFSSRGGGNKIFSRKKSEGRNLSILAISNYDKAIAPVRKTQKAVLISSFVLMVIFSAFSGILAYKISKPILTLSKEVMKFKINGFNTQIQISSSIYEIDVLGREFNHMTDQIKGLVSSLLTEEKLKQKKELEVLQAQINPHFLYNTLEVINWMALSKKQKEISNMVINLGNFLRLSLNKGKNIYTVRDEFNHLKCYMEIQNVRCNGKLMFSADIDESVLERHMIKLLLQPLVENSILHGFDSRGGIGQIWVKAYGMEEYLYFSVTDDGCGMAQELVDHICDMNSEAGYGIKNVLKRISAYYGDGCGLFIHSTEQVGTTVEIKILNEVPNQL